MTLSDLSCSLGEAEGVLVFLLTTQSSDFHHLLALLMSWDHFDYYISHPQLTLVSLHFSCLLGRQLLYRHLPWVVLHPRLPVFEEEEEEKGEERGFSLTQGREVRWESPPQVTTEVRQQAQETADLLDK